MHDDHANQIPGHQAAEVQEQAWEEERGQREQGTNWLSGKPPYWHLSPGVPQWPPVYEGSFVRA